MGRALVIGLLVSAALYVAVAAVNVDTIHAAGSASEVFSDSVTCLPPNLLPADAGHLMVPVACSTGFNAVAAETESTTPAYFCGKGPTLADYTTKCRKRCVGCNNGAAISDDTIMLLGGLYNLRCVSGGADAGVVFAVTCGK